MANNSAYAQRQAIDDSGSFLGKDVVGSAQSASAKQNALDAQIAAFNAPAVTELAARGITMSTVSFAGVLKSQMLAATDTDHNGTVSESEVEALATAGGATKSQADTLYAAMDMNGDGTVSAQEFEDSIPVPYSSGGYGQQLLKMMKTPDAQSAVLDASLIMGNLAMQQAGSASA